MKIRNTVHLGPMLQSLIFGILFTITIIAAEPPAPINHQVETVPATVTTQSVTPITVPTATTIVTIPATSTVTFPTTVTIPRSSSVNVVGVIGNSNIVVNGNIIADNKARTSCAPTPQDLQRTEHNRQRVYIVPAPTIQVIRPEPVVIVSPYVTTFWSPSPMMNRYGYNQNSGFVYGYPPSSFGYNYGY